MLGGVLDNKNIISYMFLSKGWNTTNYVLTLYFSAKGNLIYIIVEFIYDNLD